jgi:trimeric autotransporter adhesin
MSLILDGTNGLSDVDGSASTPAIRGTDTNTGIFFPAADTIAFAEGGAEVARFDSSGNLGIGTSSPSNKLQVSGSAGSTVARFTDGANGTFLFQFASSESRIQDGGANNLWAYDNSGQNSKFYTNNTERMRIASDGNLLVGKVSGNITTVGAEIRANGLIGSTLTGSTSATSTLEVYSTGAGAYRFFVGMNGTVYATSTTISSLSDQRYKENIVDLDVGLDAVMALKPRKFDWKEGKGKDIKGDRGFVAQEFETVFPDLVDEWKDPSPDGEEPYKSVRADLIPILVKAIQEQQAIITDLKARLEVLEAK